MKDLELEKGLLNLILQQPGIIDDIVEKLDIDLFTKKMHRDIFSRMMKLYNSTGEISKVKILRYGRDEYSMQGMEQLLSSDYILPMEVEVILQELQNYMNQRKLREAFVRAYKYVEDHEVSITERNAKVQDIIFESTAGIGREESLITNPEEVAIECLEKLIERQEGITVERIRTGMGPVDWILSGGLRRKNLSVLAGGTSMGKSAFALNLVRNVLEIGAAPVYYVSLEMAREELIDRLIIQKSKVRADDYFVVNEDGNRELTETQRKSVEIARDWIHDKDLLITDKRGLSVEEIKTLSRKANNMFNDDLGLIVIDYLTEIKLPKDGQNLAKTVGEAVRDLRNLSAEMDCHVLLLHQINRGFQKRNDHRPKKSDLRDSGEIEEKTDNIFFIHRPAYFEHNEPGEEEPLVQDNTELIVAKQRGGKTGTLLFCWYPEIQYFQDISDYEATGAIRYLKRGD